MTVYAEYGPLVVETDVDDAVIAALRSRLPSHLSEIERHRNLTAPEGYDHYLPRPHNENYANTLDDDEFMDHRLPAVIVTTARTTGEPQQDGEGIIYAAFSVVVSAVVRGRTPPETRKTAALYGGAVRRLLTQHQDLDGFSGDLRWIGGNVAPVQDTTGAGRYLAASINEFTVYVDQVMQAGVGPFIEGPYEPADPDDPDVVPEPLVEVSSIDVEISTPGP